MTRQRLKKAATGTITPKTKLNILQERHKHTADMLTKIYSESGAEALGKNKEFTKHSNELMLLTNLHGNEMLEPLGKAIEKKLKELNAKAGHEDIQEIIKLPDGSVRVRISADILGKKKSLIMNFKNKQRK